MRQGNGTELLGTNDSQGNDIGIIHVYPTDDRKSVLAAILTQEKLGRKQIAIVLPDQNKAFQRPVDFDDLKSLRRKLQAQLIFIAPGGPGPAEFARQRRFTVYSSLENYASALRDQAQPPASADPRKKIRGLFGSSKYKDELPASRKATANGSTPHAEDVDEGPELFADPEEEEEPVPVQAHEPAHSDEEEAAEQHEDHKIPAMVGGVLAAGAVVAGAEALHQQAARKPVITDDTVDGVDAVSLADVHNQGGYNGGFDDYDDEDVKLPPQSSPVKNEEARAVNGPSSRPGAVNAPEPIELKPVRSRGRSTAKLPPREDEMDWEDDDEEDYVAPPKRNTGKMVAAGAAVGATGLAAAALANQKAPGGVLKKGSTGKLPPRGNSGVAGAAGGNGRPPRDNRRVRPWVAIPLILLTLLIVGGIFFSIAYANPNMFGDPLGKLGIKSSTPPATVSITPDSKIVSNSYVIQAVTNGKANADQRQVMARQVLSQPQSQSKTVTGTGHNQVAATVAHGRITFTNGASTSESIGAGTPLFASNGMKIITDALAIVPAANPGVSFGVTSVPAHAARAGTDGNIGVGSISGTCCVAGNFISVRNNSAFTGGQDAKDYSFVQQGDVDSFVNGIKNQLVNQANNQLKGALKPGEQLATATQCPTTINTNNPIGDQGRNVPSTNVTVSVTCKALAYDGNSLNSIVTKLLQTKAGTDAGQGYSLQGNILIHPQVQPGGQNGNIFLLVNAKGLWVFQFSSADKQQFAKDVAGKSVGDAKTLLGSQPGIKDVTITVNNSVLPTDPNQISIVIQDVPGLQDTGNPGSTPVLPTATSSSQPGNGIINPGS